MKNTLSHLNVQFIIMDPLVSGQFVPIAIMACKFISYIEI